MATAGLVSEAKGGIQEWKEEEKEKEKEEEAAERTPMGEEVPNSPRTLLSLRGKAWMGIPMEVKLELHPLQNRWALWFFKNDRSRAWQDNLHLVTKVDSVEDFWALYSHIQLASKLSSGCDYALFKDGIEPMWEDSRNKRGGRWLVSLAKQQRHIELDRLWLETLLCLIGESFEEHSREACIQRAPGPLPEDHHWVPGPRRHSHQEQLPSQEQVCGVRGALAPLLCNGTATTRASLLCGGGVGWDWGSDSPSSYLSSSEQECKHSLT
ncbi:eukaryotic translation initiation factor 4E type 1B isoform X1 [Macaca nemestrina]|uniref:eukaryotic translation initiation factor 4E type 1B isoform X1 n=2 Tax=Macaca nemestrina TaxID=9545 RepID=UPI0039B8690A